MKNFVALVNAIASYETAVEKMFATFETFKVLPETDKTVKEEAYDAECHEMFKKMTKEFFDTVFDSNFDIEVNFEHNLDNTVTATIEYAHSVNGENISVNFMNYSRRFSTGEW